MNSSILAALLAGYVGVVVALINRMSKLQEYKIQEAKAFKSKMVALNAKVNSLVGVERARHMVNTFDEWYDPIVMPEMTADDLEDSYRSTMDGNYDGKGLQALSKEANTLSEEILIDLDFFSGRIQTKNNCFKKYKDSLNKFFMSGVTFGTNGHQSREEISEAIFIESARVAKEINRKVSRISTLEVLLIGVFMGISLFVVVQGLELFGKPN